MVKSFFWSIKDLYEIALKRQKAELDWIMVWSGRRGQGKSTANLKFCMRFDCFKPWRRYIVYSRDDLMRLIEGSQYKTIMDDEAIRSAYKRNYQEADQKVLLQMLNMYRDNFNIYSGCIPSFYGLDKDLRSLVSIHLHVVRRGLAVVHLPNENLYSDDSWDVAYNKRIEDKWAEIKKSNPHFIPPYHKLSTFAGYLKFGKLFPNQEILYKQIKKEKRKRVYENEMKTFSNKITDDYEQLAKKLIERKLTKENFKTFCEIKNLNYLVALREVNNFFRDKKLDKTAKDFFILEDKPVVTTYPTRKLHKSNKFGYESLHLTSEH